MLSPTDPVNPAVGSWATPVFAVVYLVLVIVALVSLMASKWIPAPVKVAITVGILVLPFAGSIAWIICSQVRQRGPKCRPEDRREAGRSEPREWEKTC